MGGDRAPEEVVAGALRRRRTGIEPILFGPAGLDTGGLELVDAPDVIEMAREAGRGRAREAGLVARRRRAARSRDGNADAVVSAGNTGAMLAACLLDAAARARRLPARDRRADPVAQGPSVLLDAGANADARARAPAPVRASWARSSPRRCSASSEPARAPALDRRGAREGQPARRSRRTRCSREARRARTSRGNVESRELLAGGADVIVTDGFTGNIALKLLEGTISELLDALREEITATVARQARRPADPARPRAGCARASTRTPTAARTCSGCAASP